MVAFIRRLAGLPFIRRAVLLQAGTLGAMLVQSVANIIIARMLGPEHFGFYAIAFSVASTASIVLGAGAVDALTPAATRAWHASDSAELRSIAAYLLKFSALAGVLALLVLAVLPAVTSRVYGDGAIGWYAGAILMASLVSSLGLAVLNLGLQLSGRYVHLSLLTLADMTVRFLLSVGFVALGWGVGGATFGQLVGALAVLVAVVLLWRRVSARESLWPSPAAAVTAIRSVPLGARLAPTLWVLGDRNLAMLFGALPVAIAGAYLAATEVSYFKVALGYVTLALSVTGPISTLLNVEFPKRLLQEPGSARRMFVRVSLGAMVLTTAIMVGISAVARPVITFLYGASFAPSAPLTYALFLFGATLGIGVGLGPMWRALHKVRVSMIINACTLLVGIPGGIVLVRSFGAYGACAMLTLWYVCSQGASFFWILRHLPVTASSTSV